MAHKQGTAGEAYIGWMVCGWGGKVCPSNQNKEIASFPQNKTSCYQKTSLASLFQILFEARE